MIDDSLNYVNSLDIFNEDEEEEVVEVDENQTKKSINLNKNLKRHSNQKFKANWLKNYEKK